MHNNIYTLAAEVCQTKDEVSWLSIYSAKDVVFGLFVEHATGFEDLNHRLLLVLLLGREIDRFRSLKRSGHNFSLSTAASALDRWLHLFIEGLWAGYRLLLHPKGVWVHAVQKSDFAVDRCQRTINRIDCRVNRITGGL